MTQLGAWLLALVGPLVGRVLATLGFAVVTFTGLTSVLGALKSSFITYMGQIPAAGLQLALLGGAGEAFAIIFGACAVRLVVNQALLSKRILGA